MTIFYDLSEDVNSLMIVGHNPGFTTFANYFLDEKIDNLPTSGIVGITFDTNRWENIHNSNRKVKFVISPRINKGCQFPEKEVRNTCIIQC